MAGRKKLRRGYTTGATAAAAAKAATRLLLTASTGPVTLALPWGGDKPTRRTFKPVNLEAGEGWAAAGMIKNGGDDPDATHGMELRATVSFADEPGIAIDGGVGVGRVTRPGLAAPVGGAAINPVPLAMIRDAVAGEIEKSGRSAQGVKVVISAPEGEERAKKTLNFRLGIVGGISILGTTGIVIPMSTHAWTATIDACLDVALAGGATRVMLAFGRTSERAGQREYPELAKDAAVLMGDHVGYSLDAAAARNLDVVIVGQFAKFTKLGSGSFETNVKDSTLDTIYLENLMIRAGFPETEARFAVTANTAREVFLKLQEEGDRGLNQLLCDDVVRRASLRVEGKIAVEAMLFTYAGEPVRKSALPRSKAP